MGSIVERAQRCIAIADVCGEGALLSRHGQQRPQSITSWTQPRTRRHRIGPGGNPSRNSAAGELFSTSNILQKKLLFCSLDLLFFFVKWARSTVRHFPTKGEQIGRRNSDGDCFDPENSSVRVQTHHTAWLVHICRPTAPLDSHHCAPQPGAVPGGCDPPAASLVAAIISQFASKHAETLAN